MVDQIAAIPKSWKMTTLGEVTDIKGGKRLPKDKSLVSYKTKHPYIRITDLENNKIKKNQLQFVPDEVFPSISRYIVNSGDVIVSIVGSIGFVAHVDDDLDSASLTENCVKFVNLKNLDSRFLYYFLISKLGQDEIIKNTVGAVQKKLPIYGVQNIQISLPSILEQSAIASVLSSLDDKIELLQEQSKSLEATAQAIFKEWFVNFNFPGATGKMIDSELGQIPEGWKIYELRNLFTFVKGKKPDSTSETIVSGFIPQILINTLDGGKVIFADSKNVILSNEEDLIMVMDGASSGRIEFGYSGIIGSTLSMLDFKKECRAILYFFLKSKEGEIRGSTTGSAIPHTDKEKIYQYLIALPSNKLGEFENTLNFFRKKVISNRKSIQTLSALRDALLPKLMKGEVRVAGFSD